MDNSNSKEETYDVEQIVTALENIESQDLKDNPETIDWINKITDPEFKFIESLVDLILADINDHKQIQTILKIFLKFLYYQKEATLNQLQDHPHLLKTLISYVTDNDIKDLSGEPFILIVEVCPKCDYKSVNLGLF
jgi:hypothetical protein